MNEQALIDELRKPEYSGLTDQQAADAINAKMVVVRRPVEAIRIQQAATLNGMWGTLGIARDNPSLSDPPRGAARAFIDWVTQGWPMDVDKTQVQTMAADLIRFSLVTVAQIDEIKALANVTLRWVDVNGVGECGIGYVQNARRAIVGGAG